MVEVATELHKENTKTGVGTLSVILYFLIFAFAYYEGVRKGKVGFHVLNRSKKIMVSTAFKNTNRLGEIFIIYLYIIFTTWLLAIQNFFAVSDARLVVPCFLFVFGFLTIVLMWYGPEYRKVHMLVAVLNFFVGTVSALGVYYSYTIQFGEDYTRELKPAVMLMVALVGLLPFIGLLTMTLYAYIPNFKATNGKILWDIIGFTEILHVVAFMVVIVYLITYDELPVIELPTYSLF